MEPKIIVPKIALNNDERGRYTIIAPHFQTYALPIAFRLRAEETWASFSKAPIKGETHEREEPDNRLL